MSKPQMTAAVKAGAKIIKEALQDWDIILSERSIQVVGESVQYQALTEDQKLEVERFCEWWFGMLNFACEGS